MKNRLLALVALATGAVALFLTACAGGGTSGTGGQSFVGRLATSQQQALANVIVTILQTGDSGITDADGNFDILAATEGGDINFTFTRQDISASLLLEQIPSTAEIITLELEYDQPTNTVTTKRIEVQESSSSSRRSSSSAATSSNSSTLAEVSSSTSSKSSPSCAGTAADPCGISASGTSASQADDIESEDHLSSRSSSSKSTSITDPDEDDDDQSSSSSAATAGPIESSLSSSSRSSSRISSHSSESEDDDSSHSTSSED